MAPIRVSVEKVVEVVKKEIKTQEKDILAVLKRGNNEEKTTFLEAFYDDIHYGKYAKGFGTDEPELVDALLKVAKEDGGCWSPDSDSNGRTVRMFEGDSDNWAKYWAISILNELVAKKLIKINSTMKIAKADLPAVGQYRAGDGLD